MHHWSICFSEANRSKHTGHDPKFVPQTDSIEFTLSLSTRTKPLKKLRMWNSDGKRSNVSISIHTKLEVFTLPSASPLPIICTFLWKDIEVSTEIIGPPYFFLEHKKHHFVSRGNFDLCYCLKTSSSKILNINSFPIVGKSTTLNLYWTTAQRRGSRLQYRLKD